MDRPGKKYAGIEPKWDYSEQNFRLMMITYVQDVLLKYGHSDPSKPQL